jgi:preprotein translocase subunit SecF
MNIKFVNYRIYAFALSLLLILGGVSALVVKGGFNLGIDFEAGINFQIDFSQNVEEAAIEDSLSQYGSIVVQRIGAAEDSEFSIKIKAQEDPTIGAEVERLLEADFGDVEIRSTNFVEADQSALISFQAFTLTGLALLLILAYIWLRFQLAYAFSAIAALAHDVLIMLGFIAFFEIEVSTGIIAAILTIVGYSLNDTIVIFDRIRENVKIVKDRSLTSVVNTSINQSFSRTIITSLTTLLAVIALYIFGKGQIQDFALAFIVGILVGTYSSIFVASPVLLLLKRKEAEGKPVSEEVAAPVAPAASLSSEPADIPQIERKLKGGKRKRKK